MDQKEPPLQHQLLEPVVRQNSISLVILTVSS